MRPHVLRNAALLGAVAVLSAAAASSGRAVPVPTALQAQVVDIQRPVSVQTYKTIDPSTGATGTARWRVVQGTGNCCENYLTTPAAAGCSTSAARISTTATTAA